MEIEPYLEEYFFDNLEKMDEFLWDNIKTKLGYWQSNAVIKADTVALLHPPQLWNQNSAELSNLQNIN